MRKLLMACLWTIAAAPLPALAASLDVADPKAYTTAHRELASALQRELHGERLGAALADLNLHQRELPLRELCARCDDAAKRVGADGAYEPSAWLHQPAGAESRAAQTLIAFPPAGDERAWTHVDALTLDGRWIALDVERAPDVPVIVLRVNGKLAFAKQVERANAMLREAGLQHETPLAKGTNHWTTRLEMIHLGDDEEPWISGAAEVYAITSGVLPANQPQVRIVDLPYLDHDGRAYYPRQVILDWANYSYGVANIQLYEHDDNTNYQQLVTLLIQAIGQGGSLAGYPVVQAIAEIAARIVQAMPSGWFSNDDDYVDSLYSVEKYETEYNRFGARGNARVTYIPYELPPN
jgi:hypothetical protein